MIRKYQNGGGGIYYTPFIPQLQQMAQQSPNNSAQTNLLQKEIIDVIKENGLPNDVDNFLQYVDTFLNTHSNINNLIYGNSYNQQYTIGELIKIQSAANKVKHNKELHTEAQKQLVKEGAGSEIALNTEGKMYVIDKNGSISTISLAQFKENSSNYRPLTNNELLNYRENSSSLTYNSVILSDIRDTVGIKSIVDYIKNTINSLTKDEHSAKFSKLTVKQRDQIEKGFEQMLGLNAPDGLYKGTFVDEYSHQGYNSRTGEGLKEAAHYLYTTLPTNMKNVLKVNAATNGMTAEQFLINAVVEHTDHKTKVERDIDYKAAISDTSGKSGEGSESQVKHTYPALVFDNKGDRRSKGFMIDKDTNLKINTPTYWYTPLDGKGNALPTVVSAYEADMALRDNGLRDTYQKVYFNDIPIENFSVASHQILVDYDEGMAVTFLPVNERGDIDFSLFREMNEIQKKIISERISNPEELKKIWERYGYNYDEKAKIGVPKNVPMRRFAMQQAYTTTKADIGKAVKNSGFTEEVDNSIIENLEAIYNSGHSNKKGDQIDIDYSWLRSLFGAESYKGILFIPITENQNAAYTAGNMAYVNKPNANEIKAKQDYNYKYGGFNPDNGIYSSRDINGFEGGYIHSSSLD